MFLFLKADAQIITTVVGCGACSSFGDGGPATIASIGYLGGITIDKHNNIFLADGNNNRIRKVDFLTNTITTIAGNGVPGFSGDGGQATCAQLSDPTWVAVDTLGNLYVTDPGNNRVRKIDTSGIITTFAGNGITGYSGDGIPASNASINGPQDIAVDNFGNVYIIDGANPRIRKVNSTGIISTIAGTGYTGYSGDSGPATDAQLSGPFGICSDVNGNIFFVDADNHCVRKIDIITGIIKTVAGNGLAGFNGDGGLSVSSEMQPLGVTTNDSGYIFIADNVNNRIRKVNSLGIINTVAGTGISGYGGDGGAAATCMLYRPHNLVFDRCGNLYIADQMNRRIRKVIFNPPLPSATPSLFITSGGDTVCAGAALTYTAYTSGAGTYLSYQWFVNGVSVALGTGNSYTFTPSNGDSINCIVTTANICSGPSTAISNTAHITVISAIPSISISANPPGVICLTDGSFVTFNAIATSGGSTPVYQWKKNGANTGISATSYTYIPADGDSIRCVLTSSEPCASPAVVSSNMITMTVDTIITPVITLSGSSDAAIGSTVTITASVASAGTSYIIYWMNHGTIFSTTSVPVTSYVKMADTDTITAKIIVTSGGCYDSTISQFHTVFNANEGINDFIEQGVTVFPVPVKDILHITGIKETTVYTLYEMTGRAVMSGALLPKENEINISNLATGVYLLQVQYRDGKREVRKIVKE